MLKPPLSYEDQVKRLTEHGIVIDVTDNAYRFLREVNYYRFAGYVLQYRKTPSDSNLITPVSFSDVLSIYRFDADIRDFLRKYLEIAEIYYKSLISNEFALKHCMQPPYDQHYDVHNYYDQDRIQDILDSFQDDIDNHYQDSLIVKHHKARYNSKMPIWAMFELFTFSRLSSFYYCMYTSDQKLISNHLGIAHDVLTNHLHCLSVLRNKCSHAARLYNTTFSPSVKLPLSVRKKHKDIDVDSLFAYIIVLRQRLPNPSIKAEFLKELIDLIAGKPSSVDLKCMGFPNNYEDILKKL